MMDSRCRQHAHSCENVTFTHPGIGLTVFGNNCTVQMKLMYDFEGDQFNQSEFKHTRLTLVCLC